MGLEQSRLDTLQKFLDNAQIPEFKPKPKTFLEIAKQPHYENVISNIYAFYLDPFEEHGLEDLFINSLVNCLNDKRGKNWVDDFTDFEIYTEYSTKKGRIDILLLNSDSAIIIENKIYHHLNNDLREYSEYVKNQVSEEKNVYGLVIGLKEEDTSKYKNYVSLTHQEFLDKVFRNLGDYILRGSEKYLFFLKDLYQNIINLSTQTMNEKELEFYLSNENKIIDLMKLKNQFELYIKREVESLEQKLDDVKLYSSRAGSSQESRLRYLESNKTNGLYITVVFDNLLNENNYIFLIIELWHHAYRNFYKLYENNLYGSISGKLDLNKDFLNNRDGNAVWSQFSCNKVDIANEDIKNFSDFLVYKINELDIYKTFKAIENELLQQNDNMNSIE